MCYAQKSLSGLMSLDTKLQKVMYGDKVNVLYCATMTTLVVFSLHLQKVNHWFVSVFTKKAVRLH